MIDWAALEAEQPRTPRRTWCHDCRTELTGRYHPAVHLITHYIHVCPEFDGTRDRRTANRKATS